MAQIFMDDGGGVTERSLKYFHEIKPQLGTIVSARSSYKPLQRTLREIQGAPYTAEYTLILKDNKGNEVWLSGCNSGYGGTGPHGTFDLLVEVGLIPRNTDFWDTKIPKTHDEILWTTTLTEDA